MCPRWVQRWRRGWWSPCVSSPRYSVCFVSIKIRRLKFDYSNFMYVYVCNKLSQMEKNTSCRSDFQRMWNTWRTSDGTVPVWMALAGYVVWTLLCYDYLQYILCYISILWVRSCNTSVSASSFCRTLQNLGLGWISVYR